MHINENSRRSFLAAALASAVLAPKAARAQRDWSGKEPVRRLADEKRHAGAKPVNVCRRAFWPSAVSLDDKSSEIGGGEFFQTRRFIDAPMLDGEIGRGENGRIFFDHARDAVCRDGRGDARLVARNPATVQALCDCGSCFAANEKISNYTTFAGVCD